jgi:hypothetical protein
MRIARATSALLAVALAVAALFGCGSGDQSTDTAPGAAGVERSGETTTANTGTATPARQKTLRAPTKHETAAKGNPSESGGSSEKQSRQQPQQMQQQQTGQAKDQAPKRNEKCPSAMSNQQCLQAGHAYKQAQQKGNSQTVGAKECPPSMGADACEEAGAISQEAPPGTVVQANECPPAMSEQQCVEAGKLYEEATK